MARLFRKFSRIRNEKTEGILESGPRLSLVHKIAAIYGGRVDMSSAPDRGSTFTVQLRSLHEEPAGSPGQ